MMGTFLEVGATPSGPSHFRSFGVFRVRSLLSFQKISHPVLLIISGPLEKKGSESSGSDRVWYVSVRTWLKKYSFHLKRNPTVTLIGSQTPENFYFYIFQVLQYKCIIFPDHATENL